MEIGAFFSSLQQHLDFACSNALSDGIMATNSPIQYDKSEILKKM